LKLPPKDQMIIGVQPIRELLRLHPQRILRVYTGEHKQSELLNSLVKHNIPITFVKKDQLTKMAGTESHQMLLAQITPRDYFTVQRYLERAKTPSLLLIMDQIFDPQNFGAILRCAECFGASAVLWSKNRGTELTPTAAKASSGASELLPLIRISNLATAVDQLKTEGFEIVAAQMTDQAESSYDFTFAPKTALIMGSEGEGIQPLLQKKACRSIFIPMAGHIRSLNVAQATAVLLALWNRGPR